MGDYEQLAAAIRKLLQPTEVPELRIGWGKELGSFDIGAAGFRVLQLLDVGSDARVGPGQQRAEISSL